MGALNITGYLSLLDQLLAMQNITVKDVLLYDRYLTHSNENCTVDLSLYIGLLRYTKPIIDGEFQEKYSEPMPWIGMYIALASILCILAMAADLFDGLKNRKLWFPCKYFTLNAASLSVIAVAIKLPMDLNNSMPAEMDQAAKLGSMAFMCTMMANLLPSLATMDNKELLTNIIALVVLVITLVVNVCIQIRTGVVSIPTDYEDELEERLFNVSSIYEYKKSLSLIGYVDGIKFVAIIYVVMLLVLLIIHTCSALTIVRSKQILEPKYKAGHERASKDLEQQTPERLNVEKLKQFVSRHWIMAGTGSPQFMAPAFTSDVSDYGLSVPVIFLTQFIGVILGTIAPLSRCFASLSFKMSTEWIWEHIKVFKVESYWTQKLNDWKESSIPSPFRSRKCNVVIENSKLLILSICIGIQKTVVVVCKIMTLIPIFFMACLIFCSICWKWLKVKFSASSTVRVTKHHEQLPQDEKLRPYVLQLQDDP